MKSVLYGIGAMIAISVVAWLVLDTQSTGSDEHFISQNNSVRLD